VEKGSHGALSAPGRLTPQTLMKGGATPSRPASTVEGLTFVDSTLHVMIVNLETLAAVSSMSMLASIWINQWLSGVSQSEGWCYILTLPLLFLTPLHPFIYPPTKSLIPGTALPSSLTSPIPFLLTLLISSLVLPLNCLTSSPCYALRPYSTY